MHNEKSPRIEKISPNLYKKKYPIQVNLTYFCQYNASLCQKGNKKEEDDSIITINNYYTCDRCCCCC